MKNKHILIMLLATALLLGSTACHKDAQIEPKTLKVTEPDVSFTATTADFGWAVSFPGKVSSVVKVSRHADMSDATSYGDATPTSNKDFHVEITGLSPETQYYYCFEIWNPNLNHRSEVKSFTTWTVTKPSVTTSTATDISWTTATTGGNVTDDGNDVILECGVCWGNSHNPDTGSDFSHLAASSAGTGEYSCTLTGLAPGTKYYVRAYATNSKGTSYGDEKDFTTQVLQKPTVTTASVSQFNFTNATAVGGGEVTSDGGDPVTERGIFFGTSPNPAATGTKLVASSAGTDSFTCTITGLVEETTYYVCAYASNRQGTSYGSEKSFSLYYVDLGLPSGLLWATCNVGADSPEDYGDYFAWGETQPKGNYYWGTYQYCNGSYLTLTKYCNTAMNGYNGFTDNLTTLQPNDDVATAQWGSSWRMPTEAEWQELLDNTAHEWTTQNGVKGRRFTASNGNSLFLPAAGYRYWSTLYDAGSRGIYQSSSLYTGNPGDAWKFDFGSDYYGLDSSGRESGLSVRAVRSSRQN